MVRKLLHVASYAFAACVGVATSHRNWIEVAIFMLLMGIAGLFSEKGSAE
jgi:hypothetical protein